MNNMAPITSMWLVLSSIPLQWIITGDNLLKFVSTMHAIALFNVSVVPDYNLDVISHRIYEKTPYWNENTYICSTLYIVKNVYPWWHITLNHHYIDSYIWLDYIFSARYILNMIQIKGNPHHIGLIFQIFEIS